MMISRRAVESLTEQAQNTIDDIYNAVNLDIKTLMYAVGIRDAFRFLLSAEIPSTVFTEIYQRHRDAFTEG